MNSSDSYSYLPFLISLIYIWRHFTKKDGDYGNFKILSLILIAINFFQFIIGNDTYGLGIRMMTPIIILYYLIRFLNGDNGLGGLFMVLSVITFYYMLLYIKEKLFKKSKKIKDSD